MRKIILFLLFVYGFSYVLRVDNVTDAKKLSGLGVNCIPHSGYYECVSSNDRAQLEKMKKIFMEKFHINTFIDDEKIHNKNKGKYCIQITSSLNKKAVFKYFEGYKRYPYARVEKIGSYYVIRIGLESYDNIKALYNRLKKGFVRKCDYIESRIVKKSENTENTKSFKYSDRHRIFNIRNRIPDNKDRCNIFMGLFNLPDNPQKALRFFKLVKNKNRYLDSLIGYAYIGMRKYKKAYEIFKNLIKTGNAPDITKGYVSVLYRLGKYDELVKEALKYDKYELTISLNEIEDLIYKNKKEQAYLKLLTLYESYPHERDVLLALGFINMEMGKKEEAEYFFSEILKKRTDVFALKGMYLLGKKEMLLKELKKMFKGELCELRF